VSTEEIMCKYREKIDRKKDIKGVKQSKNNKSLPLKEANPHAFIATQE